MMIPAKTVASSVLRAWRFDSGASPRRVLWTAFAAAPPVALSWSWLDNIFGDQKRMIQIGAVIVVLAILGW